MASRRLASLVLGVVALALVAPALAADQSGGNAGDSIGQGDNSPNSAAISQMDYILQPYDLIHVVVFQEPDLEREVRLSDTSDITLPLIGLVNLRGKTIGQAQKLISYLYNKDYLVNPQITVTVLEFAKETVNVLGSVTNAGAIEIPPDHPLNLIDAITRAGGFTRLADRKRVKLTEIGPDGRTVTQIINVDDIIQSQTADRFILHKGDVIFVPERIL